MSERPTKGLVAQRWGLIVEENAGRGQGLWWRAKVLEEVVGSREEALRRLQLLAEVYKPKHPTFETRRKRAYRLNDGFFVLYLGAIEEFPCRVSVAEMIFDSGT